MSTSSAVGTIIDTNDDNRAYRRYNANLYCPNLWTGQLQCEKIITNTIKQYVGNSGTAAVTSYTLTPLLLEILSKTTFCGELFMYLINGTTNTSHMSMCILAKNSGDSGVIKVTNYQNVGNLTTNPTFTSTSTTVTISTSSAVTVTWIFRGQSV